MEDMLYTLQAWVFQVDAFDLSKMRLKKIDYLKQKNNLNVHTWVCDVLDYPFRYSYDLIIVHGVYNLLIKQNNHK